MEKHLFEQRVQPLLELAPRTKYNKTAKTHYEECCLPRAKSQPTRCDDCNLIKQGPIEQKIWIKNFGGKYPKWAKKCLTCRKEVEIVGAIIKLDK
jgi:hypothetical protein